MKQAEVLAIAVIAVIVLALVAKGKEQPIQPVLLPEPEPPPEEPIIKRPAPQPRPVLSPEPVLPPELASIPPWQWHCEAFRGTGLVLMNPETGQIVRGLSRRQRESLRRVGWVFPSSRLQREAEVRQRPPGIPRILERSLPPDWPRWR